MTPPPLARLRQGTYSGTVLETTFGGENALPWPIEAFLGVPYGRVFVADGGRFREARPVASSGGSPSTDEAIRATEYGPVCPATTREDDEEQGRTVDDDCLNANIFRPAGAAPAPSSRGSPVVVFFHGGCFNFGNGADRDMASFVAHAAFPVVAVSFNYRLGPLGFLSCGAAQREGVLNLGLKDQQRLLVWVAENIAAFGGDADNVTLMGVSAGAHSIGHHILSSGSSHPSTGKRLFRKAILESGSPNARSVLSPSHPRHELQLRQFLARCSLPGDLPDAQLFPSLRSLPLSTILEASASVWASHSSSLCWPFQPTIDGPGGIVPDMPMKLASSSLSSAGARGGSPSPVPLITGFNSHEGTLFVPADAHTNDDFRRFFQILVPSLSDADLDVLERLYPESPPTAAGHASPYYSLGIPKGYGAQFPRLATAYAWCAYIAPVLHTAHLASRSRGAGGGGGPVYVYEFAARADEDLKAANHGDESALVVRDVDQLGAHPGLMRTSKRMHGLFSQFVASAAGDPNETTSANTSVIASSSPDPQTLRTDTIGRDETTTAGGNGESLSWPEFLSPFAEDAPPGAGQILVFGEGNDERCGGEAQGCVARARTLTALEMRQCRFWWERMELCQGMGVRDASPRAEKCRSSL